MREVQISLAAFPGMRHEQAAEEAICGAPEEPLWGRVGHKHVQLVPQSFGLLDEGLCESLTQAFSQTQFRLHANVRVLPKHVVAELSGLDLHQEWFEQAARLSRMLKAPAYTAHAGSRAESSFDSMLEKARRLADMFECPVGVEGHYPSKSDAMLVSSWEEYRLLFESGVPYALDLSHLNIVACHSGREETNLVREMLACERCIEVHVSENDGKGDSHQVCRKAPWWHPLVPYINDGAVIFTEGNHRRFKKEQTLEK